jgi:predicted MFS family arabinose efflux permease
MTNSRQSRRWVLALTAIASFMVALDALVVSTALSTIRTDLGTSIGQLEWTVNAYLLSFAVLMMTASALLWSASLFGTLFFVAQFLQTALGHGPLAAGALLMPWGAAAFVVLLFSRRLVERTGDRPVVSGGLALQAAGSGWLALVAGPHVAYWQVLSPLRSRASRCPVVSVARPRPERRAPRAPRP